MPVLRENSKIADMTVGEFKALIRETVLDAIDPDSGLELRPEVEARLRESMAQAQRGEGVSLDEAKKQLGLK